MSRHIEVRMHGGFGSGVTPKQPKNLKAISRDSRYRKFYGVGAYVYY